MSERYKDVTPSIGPIPIPRGTRVEAQGAPGALDLVPVIQHALLIAVAGVVVTQWEKLAAWVIAGFAAALALVLANYAKAVELTDLRTVYWVLVLFVIAAVLHVLQRIATTMVQAGVAGGEAAAKLDLKDFPHESLPRLMEGISSAYPWPLNIPIRGRFRRIMNGDLQHVGKILLRTALSAALLAVVQIILGLVAIVKIGLALHVLPT